MSNCHHWSNKENLFCKKPRLQRKTAKQRFTKKMDAVFDAFKESDAVTPQVIQMALEFVKQASDEWIRKIFLHESHFEHLVQFVMEHDENVAPVLEMIIIISNLLPELNKYLLQEKVLARLLGLLQNGTFLPIFYFFRGLWHLFINIVAPFDQAKCHSKSCTAWHCIVKRI